MDNDSQRQEAFISSKFEAIDRLLEMVRQDLIFVLMDTEDVVLVRCQFLENLQHKLGEAQQILKGIK